jgi:cytidine deaminase
MLTPDELLARARDVVQRAHAPYSGYQVGCALETAQGGIFTGCNVENASYGLTICAERNSIFQAVAHEGSVMRVRQLVVIAIGQEFPPCGACRQVIAEFSQAETQIWFLQHGQLICRSMAQLLPESFRL